MKLATSRVGSGPPLALVHGWGLGPQAWQCVVPSLADYFTVHSVALPGYAGSPAAGAADMNALAEALAETLPEAATLCGWSLGAMIALTCAARYPERVQRLILVSANGRFVRSRDWPEALPAAQLDAFVRQLDDNAPALLSRFAALVNHGDRDERVATRSLRGCLESGLPADVASLRAGLALLRDANPAVLAQDVAQPTLVLHGSADPLMPLAGAQRLTASLADARLHVFADAAHAPFASQPRQFVEQLVAFAGLPTCPR